MKGLVLIYLITGAASIGALRYPLVGLYAYVGFAVLRPQAVFGWAGDLSGISLYVGAAMLVGWALNGFGSWRFGRARAVVVSLGLFVLWFALSGLLALNTTRSFDSLLELSKVVLPVLVGVTMIREAKHWRWLLWVIVLCQGYAGFEMNLDYLFKGYNTAANGYGGMDNNFFALALVTALGPAVALAIASRTWWEKGFAAAAAALILHTTLLTFSRGGMLGLLAVAATAFVMMPKKPKHMIAVLAVVLLAVRLTGPQLAARYSTVFVSSEEELDGSAESRLDLWRDCLMVVGQYPVFGVGPANWRVIASSYGWPEGKSAHSVWMETAAENGIPGALFLMLFFGITARRLWPIARGRTANADPYEQALAAGGVLAIVGFSVTGQFVSAPSLEIPYYIVTACIAMLKLKSVEAPLAAEAPAPAAPAVPGPTAHQPAAPQRPRVVPQRPAPVRVIRRPAGRASRQTGLSGPR